MLLVTDKGNKRNIRRAQDAIVKHQETNAATARGEARARALVENKETSVANAEHQQGRGMSATVFMNKLRTINRDLVLEPHPALAAPKDTAFYRLNFDKACLYLTLPDGKKEFLFVCEGDFMPEWSSMSVGTTRVPDNKPEGVWKEVPIPWHLVKRGWREVLLRLITKRLISVTDAERVFGPGDRASWKIITGKGYGILPI